jgi:hypothetical protein
MVLPGKLAKEVRKQFADVIHRYMAGDSNLISEIQANAQSAAPVAQIARETLADIAPPAAVHSPEDFTRKRKLEAIDLERAQIENERARAEVCTAQIANFNRMAGVIETVEKMGSWEHVRTARHAAFCMLEDLVSTRVEKASPVRLAVEGPKPLRISTVIAELNYGYISEQNLLNIGAKLRQLYVEKHGSEPRKDIKSFSGGYGPVNVYTEDDREIIVQAIRFVLDGAVF